jgi:hypothetical protein
LPLESYLETIIDLGGYVPFYVQIACSILFDALSKSQEADLDMQAVTRHFTQETTSDFRYIWDRFDADKRDAIGTLAGRGSVDVGLQDVVEELIEDGYVVVNGADYRLFSTAFVRFVERYAAEAIPVAQERQKKNGQAQKPAKSKKRLALFFAAILLLGALACGVYVLHLYHPTDPTPMLLEAGRASSLPVDGHQPFYLDWDVPQSVIYLVFVAARDRQLEELYQRLQRVPRASKESYQRRLVGRIARLAMSRIELPLAQAQDVFDEGG